MVRHILAAGLLIISCNLYSQEFKKNSYGISGGPGILGTLGHTSTTGVDGAMFEVGFSYYRRMTTKITFESGLLWHHNNLEASSDILPFNSRRYTVGFLYIPALMKLAVTPYFFIQAGPLIDIDPRSNRSITNQTGLGASLGIGFELPACKKWMIQFNSCINIHSWAISKSDPLYPNPMVDFIQFRMGIRTR